MPIDYRNYPPNWSSEIRPAILLRAGNACEGSPQYPGCRARNRHRHPVTGSVVVLTVAHLDHDPSYNEAHNLRAWCQRCHLTYDATLHAARAKKTKLRREFNAQQLPLW